MLGNLTELLRSHTHSSELVVGLVWVSAAVATNKRLSRLCADLVIERSSQRCNCSMWLAESIIDFSTFRAESP